MVEPVAAQFRLKIIAWIIALPCIAVELVAKWLCFPISPQLRGFQFPLFGYAPEHHGVSLFSHGVIAAGLCAIGAFALGRKKWKLLNGVGVALVWLGVLAILQVAFTDAPLLKSLASEMDQQQTAASFTQAALPVNFGEEPGAWPRLPLDTVGNRLIAAWYFARAGWWLALLLGICALGFGIAREKRLTMAWVALAGAAALCAVCATRPALAEFAASRARVAEARGETDKAFAEYRRAIHLDRWNAENLDLYERIGAMDASLNRTSTVEYGIYHAGLPSTQIDMAKAIAEMSALIPRASQPLARVLRNRVAELYTQYARTLHASGAYGKAITACEAAQRLDPQAFLPAYYLSREYFLLADYPQSIDLTQKSLRRVADPVLRANLYGNLGDAYTKLGQFQEAKLAYRASYKWDYLLNLRGLSALTGP